MMPAALKNVQRAHQVAVDIDMRIGHRMTNPRLGREVHDPVYALILEQRLHPRAVGQVKPGEAETVLCLQTRQARLFEADVVVVVQIVETQYFIAPGQQAGCNKVTDKAGCPGDEYPHDVQRPAYSRPSTSAAGNIDLMS
jgi:hypothetical protein